MLPKIKKNIQKFLLDETGSISKKSILKLGVVFGFASLSANDVSSGGADCGEKHCNESYAEEGLVGGFTLTEDMSIIIEEGGGNVLYDSDTHMSETQSHSSSHVALGNDKCEAYWSYADASHGNCYFCLDWGVDCCKVTGKNDFSEHWNAAHHLNDIDLSSDDFLKIVAEHKNYVAYVSQDVYAYEICGSQHSSEK